MADLKALDKFFEDKTFLSGDRLSPADLAFVSSLKYVYEKALGNKSRAAFRNFNRYYNTIINQPEFKKVANLELFKQDGAPAGKAAQPKAEKPKAEKQAKAPAAPSGADIMDDIEAENKKAESKDPFAVLPATKFNFDDYKRNFSNNPPEVYLPYFWEKFDAENCSIWLCEYKYNDELGLVFMSANLVRGILQRLDKARKQSLGSMVVYGEDGKNMIAGLWIWRGQDLMFNLSENWQVDYESFEWKKLDPKTDETKQLIELFLKQDEGSSYKGMKYADGKIFK